MDKNAVSDLFRKFESLTIVVIGDVMIDSYLWGKVDRISPEAPVPVVSSTRKENRLGGAANVALNLKSLGAKAVMCSVIGSDGNSSLFRNLMKDENLADNLIVEDRERITTIKTRIISGSQQLLRVDEENVQYLSKDTEKLFAEKLMAYLSHNKVDAILFQDYDKGVITPTLIEQITETANVKGIPTLVDPKRRNFEAYRHVSLFKPNFKEFLEGLKTDFDRHNMNQLHAASRAYLEQSQNRFLLLTLSDLGIFITDGQKHRLIPAHKRDITDVSGAGDTVISVAALCMASHCNPAETAAMANLAGGLVCEKIGVVPVERERLMQEALYIDLIW